MFHELGYEVKRLVRTRIGPLRLENLRPGEWRLLNAQEIKNLREQNAPREKPAHQNPKTERPR